ncbi:unnamed protein product [Lupinus luteus]|uniref:Uncharacterized protein n=1 Tax=Lupinus luteus TaxID=3873 RepID=A0AAV1W319_LUPLU
MASGAESDRKEPVNEQAVANIYAAMRSELNQIYSKITEMEMERTIKEVLPAVLRNKDGIEEIVARLNEALEKKKKEIADFETKYKIRIRKADAEVKDESGKKEGLFRRLNQAIPARPACAEVVLGQDKFSPLGSRLCRRQLYLRTNRCPPRVSGEKSQEGSRLRGRHLRHS